MRFSIASSLLLLAGVANAASAWGFSDASVSVTSKKAAAVTEKFSEKNPVKKTLSFGHADTIKVSLTTKDGSKAKRPHQAFLVVKESSGLEAPYPLTLKESGKGTVEFTHKDLPAQLLLSKTPLQASLILGSFGSSKGSVSPLFEIDVQLDTNAPAPGYEAPLRYGKVPEIHHTFRADPKSPPKIISLVFALAVLAAVPALFLGWLALGANVNHLQKAFGTAPISHAVFFGSILAIEGTFFLYYTTWNLFQTVPVVTVLGVISFLSGNKALAEVQSRRLAGER
ncbi:hypothetical protein G7046_g6909 [Stylonectria norvegica]|nr:hypothetical protein G7046_g6909 [Stylonectria norvegica]